ncbi:MAG: hypothetical protein NZ866_01230 [Patescibacteria group bacterium]|nr:hypothetical protein [Patescibacteria group bacterium]
MKKIKIKPKNIALIISHDNLTILGFKKNKNNEIQIINKTEIKKNLFSNSSINKELFSEAIKILKEEYKSQSINIILNLPRFFIQKFNIPNLEKVEDKNIIENKIKEEIPINLERYFWKTYINPNNYENVTIIFYEKEILEKINNEFIINNLLVLKNQPLFSLLIGFIREKYALAYDKSYLILSLIFDTLTIISYENGFITNLFSEKIESENKKEIIERILNSSIRLLTSPLDIIFLISDEKIDLDLINNENFKIINIQKDLNISPLEIFLNSIIKENKTDFLSEFNLNIYNLEKEINLYNFNNSFKIWLVVILIIGFLINSLLFFSFIYLNQKRENLIKEISIIKDQRFNLDEIKNLIISLNNLNNNLIIYKNLEILDKLKNFKFVNFDFQSKSGLIIIQEDDKQKKEYLLNYLKNNLKLNNIKEENNLIYINLTDE